jgi:hypothetical protein
MANRTQPESPHQDRLRLNDKAAISKPMVPHHEHVRLHQLQPTMRLPEHFKPHLHPAGASEEARSPAASSPVIENDARSEVSPLQCGSVPPDPNYNPAHDPFLQPPQEFVPPLEIAIPVMIAIEEEEATEEQRELTESPLRTPEWLQLPVTDSKNKKKKRTRQKVPKNKAITDQSGKGHRSGWFRASDRPTTGGENAPIDLHVSFSEDSPPVFAIKPGTAALYQDLPVLNTVSESTSSTNAPSFHRIVIDPDGRPIYADQEERVDSDLVVGTAMMNVAPCGPEQQDGAIGPSFSFSESYQTSPTIYESSSEQHAAVVKDGVEIGINTEKSPRKGMVRREFQRRFLWFKPGSKAKPSDSAVSKESISNKGKRLEKTAKTMGAEWKQSSGSCMV